MFALDGSEGCLQTLVLFMVLFMLFVLPCLQVLCKRVQEVPQDSSMHARAAAVADHMLTVWCCYVLSAMLTGAVQAHTGVLQDSSMQARAAAVAEDVAVPPIFTQLLASPMQCPSFFHECCLCCHAHTLVLFVLSCLQGLCKRIQQVLEDSSMHMLELNMVTLWYP